MAACSICDKDIAKTDEIVSRPCCQATVHSSCIQGYVSYAHSSGNPSPSCPICRQQAADLKSNIERAGSLLNKFNRSVSARSSNDSESSPHRVSALSSPKSHHVLHAEEVVQVAENRLAERDKRASERAEARAQTIADDQIRSDKRKEKQASPRDVSPSVASFKQTISVLEDKLRSRSLEFEKKLQDEVKLRQDFERKLKSLTNRTQQLEHSEQTLLAKLEIEETEHASCKSKLMSLESNVLLNESRFESLEQTNRSLEEMTDSLRKSLDSSQQAYDDEVERSKYLSEQLSGELHAVQGLYETASDSLKETLASQDELQKEHEVLIDQCAELTTQLDQSQSEYKRLSESLNDSMSNAEDEYKNKIADLEMKCQQLTLHATDATNKLTESIKSEKLVGERCSALVAENQRLKHSTSQAEGLKAETRDLKSQISKALDDARESAQRFLEKELEEAKLLLIVEKANRELSDCEALLEEQNKNFKVVSEEKEALEQKLESLQQSSDEGEVRCNAALESVKSIQDRLAALTSQSEEECRATSLLNAQLEQRLDESESQCRNFFNTIQSFEAQLATLTASLDFAEKKFQSASESNETLSQKCEDLKFKSDSFEESCSILDLQVKKLSAINSDLEASLSDANSRSNDLENKYQCLVEQSECRETEFERSLSELRNLKDALDQEHDLLKASSEELVAKCDSISRERDENAFEIEDLKARLLDESNQVAELRGQLEQSAAQLQAAADMFSSEMSDLKLKSDDDHAKITALSESLAESCSSFEAVRLALENAKEQLDIRTQENRLIEEQISNLNDSLIETLEEKEKLLEDNASIRHMLGVVEDQLSNIKRQVLDGVKRELQLSDSLTKLSHRYNEDINRSQEELAIAKKTIESLVDEQSVQLGSLRSFEELEQVFDAGRLEVIRLSSENSRIIALLDATRDAGNDSQEQLAQLQKETQIKDDNLVSLKVQVTDLQSKMLVLQQSKERDANQQLSRILALNTELEQVSELASVRMAEIETLRTEMVRRTPMKVIDENGRKAHSPSMSDSGGHAGNSLSESTVDLNEPSTVSSRDPSPLLARTLSNVSGSSAHGGSNQTPNSAAELSFASMPSSRESSPGQMIPMLSRPSPSVPLRGPPAFGRPPHLTRTLSNGMRPMYIRSSRTPSFPSSRGVSASSASENDEMVKQEESDNSASQLALSDISAHIEEESGFGIEVTAPNESSQTYSPAASTRSVSPPQPAHPQPIRPASHFQPARPASSPQPSSSETVPRRPSKPSEPSRGPLSARGASRFPPVARRPMMPQPIRRHMIPSNPVDTNVDRATLNMDNHDSSSEIRRDLLLSVSTPGRNVPALSRTMPSASPRLPSSPGPDGQKSETHIRASPSPEGLEDRSSTTAAPPPASRSTSSLPNGPPVRRPLQFRRAPNMPTRMPGNSVPVAKPAADVPATVLAPASTGDSTTGALKTSQMHQGNNGKGSQRSLSTPPMQPLRVNSTADQTKPSLSPPRSASLFRRLVGAKSDVSSGSVKTEFVFSPSSGVWVPEGSSDILDNSTTNVMDSVKRLRSKIHETQETMSSTRASLNLDGYSKGSKIVDTPISLEHWAEAKALLRECQQKLSTADPLYAKIAKFFNEVSSGHEAVPDAVSQLEDLLQSVQKSENVRPDSPRPGSGGCGVIFILTLFVALLAVFLVYQEHLEPRTVVRFVNDFFSNSTTTGDNLEL
uniref:RING-type domain-containing protein n=1 Tax=Spongospora subterranea TaxID=70186 RepID=A0A0H5R132_9EUKA|eukprot:CRZ01504.1 hypothetical protein [Spongospora subterranea]